MEQKETNRFAIKCFMEKMGELMNEVSPENKSEYERLNELMELAKSLSFEDASIHTYNLNYFFKSPSKYRRSQKMFM